MNYGSKRGCGKGGGSAERISHRTVAMKAKKSAKFGKKGMKFGKVYKKFQEIGYSRDDIKLVQSIPKRSNVDRWKSG